MKIGIFLHPYGEREPAGLGRAILDLTTALVAASPQDEFMIYVKGDTVPTLSLSGGKATLYALGTGWRWRDRAMARERRADVYLFHTPVLPLLRRPQKSVVIALDFAYLAEAPAGARGFIRRIILRVIHKYAMRACTAVVAISEATRREAIRLFGIPERKITAVHLGYRPLCTGFDQPTDCPEKFFLFVGVAKERKNVRAIVRAFARFAVAHPAYHLLLAGKSDGEYGALVRHDAEQSGTGGRIRFLGYQSDAELAFLYRRATALVYPSKIEGFGFPVLEAMQCGTAVITSRVSSLPELAGDAALLVDPDDIGAIAGAMARLADDPVLRADLVARGRAQAEKFSWEKCAREILNILHTI